MVRNPSDQNLIQDRTSTINKMENMYGLFTQLGIWQESGVRTRTFQYDVTEDGFALIPDSPWGARRDQFVGKSKFKTYSFAIPHFTFDGKIKPEDVAEKRAPGTDAEFDTLDAQVAKELLRIRNSWAMTREWSKRNLIVNGTVYAPNGTVDVNYFTALGVTRQTIYYNIATNNTTVEVWDKGEQARSYIRDNLLDGSIVNNYVAICSKEFFKALISHNSVKESYKYYANNNRNGEFMRERLPTVMGGYRSFLGGDGILYIEYDGSIKGTPMIPANEAYIIPMDASGLFQTIYAPMSHVDYVNTVGQSQYAFVYALERGQGWDIETESNFADFCAKPNLIVKASTAASG